MEIDQVEKICLERLREFGTASAMPVSHRDSGVDAVVEIGDPPVRFPVQVKPSVYPRLVQELAPGLDQAILACERLSRKTFEICRERRISAVDTNGSILLFGPNLYVERFVDARPQKKSSGKPFSAKASRVARLLLSRPNHVWLQKELERDSEISQGYLSKTISQLVDGRYVHRLGHSVKLLEPDRLLDDWAAHYRFDRHRRGLFAANFSTYEGGLESIARHLREKEIRYAFTGWSGAFLRAPYGIPKGIMIYLDCKIDEVDFEPLLFPVTAGANVTLYQPHDLGVFQARQQIQDYDVVSSAQLYLDLERMPGRAGEQAEVLRDQVLEPNWRRT